MSVQGRIRGGNPAAIASAVGNLLPIGNIVNAISSAVNKDKEKELANIQKDTELMKTENGQKIYKAQVRGQMKKTKYHMELDRLWDREKISDQDYKFIKWKLESYLAEDMHNEFLDDMSGIPPGPPKTTEEVIADIKDIFSKEYTGYINGKLKIENGVLRPSGGGVHRNNDSYEAFILQKNNEIRQATLNAPKYRYSY